MEKPILNIAMISYHTCPLATLGGKDTGGMNVYVRELTRHLGKINVHVDVFTRSQDEHVPHVLHDLGFGNRVVHVPAGPEVPLPKKKLAEYIPEFIEGIQRFAEEKNIHYDLIHSHYWMSGVAGENLKNRWQVPMVHMFHTLGMMKNRVARSEEEMEGEYRINGERQVIKAADRIIAATAAEQSQLEFLYKAPSSKVAIIPPGVDTEHFYPIPPDESKAVVGICSECRMFLFVGRIEPLKGVDTLIHAIAILNDKGLMTQRPYSLSIIGGEPELSPLEINAEMARLKQLCHNLGLDDMVVFLGKRSQDSLAYYYSAAEAVIMPSHYESFGMVALEAMACGTPVVASQVGGLAFLVQDGVTGFVIPNNDPQILADRLARLILEPDLSQKLGEQAEDCAQEYAWPKITARIVELYKTVLETRKSAENPGIQTMAPRKM
jgi:D-inositol-3-phosphate glycosyltransferase